MRKLENILIRTLLAQLAFYVLTHLTFFLSIKGEDTDFSGLVGLLWLFIYALLGVVNLILFIVYVYKAVRNKERPSQAVIWLTAVAVLTAVSYVKVSEWLS